MGKGGQEAGVHFLIIIPEFKQTAEEPVCSFLFLILLKCQCLSKHKTGMLSDDCRAVDDYIGTQMSMVNSSKLTLFTHFA